jgi:hypothetical protein
MTVPLNLARQSTAIAAPPPPPMPMASRAIMAGQRRFTGSSAVPVLAIFADPHDVTGADNDVGTEAQAVAFEHTMPPAHVVRLAGANHYVFRSNEADVLREINAFIAGLPVANATD